ncbi:MAG: type 1 glutamine amidotransferase [Planctomycetes bacterium]|nr:type 1 glutamine amidotransferase [Planctomycetota bacterium]
MKALILTADGVEDSEFFYPYYRLQEEGIHVDVATPDGQAAMGKHGYPVPANLKISDARADDYDLLVLPGGQGPEKVRVIDNAVKIARAMMDAGKVVASICHGVQTLISADVLKGRRATCWKGVRDDLKAAGADYRDEEVVVDGTLVTSRAPHDLPAFMRETLALATATVSP